MTPSGFFERIRSAVCEKAVAFWREDTSPKKRRTDSGEEALLSAEISTTRSKVVFCLFFIGLVAVLGKAFWCSAASRRPFAKARRSALRPHASGACAARSNFRSQRRGPCFDHSGAQCVGRTRGSFKTHGSAVRSAGGSLGRVRSRDSRAH